MIVTQAQLEALAAQAPKPEAKPPTSNGQHRGEPFDLVAWLARHGIEHGPAKPWQGGSLFELEACPFNGDHRGGSACVMQGGDGRLGFKCHHQSCYGRDWQALRKHLEPDRQQYNGNGQAARRHAIDSEVDTYNTDDDQPPPEVNGHAKREKAAEREQKIVCLERFTTRDLLENSPRPKWLIKQVLVDEQPGVFLGSFKTLKTTISSDCGVSLATATPFMNYFEVPEARRVGMLSGESGRHTLSLQVQRICAARGIDPYTQLGNLIWSTEIPNLTKAMDLERLRKFITGDELQVCFFDPVYLLLAGAAKDAGNVFAMGEVLSGLAQVGRDTGCTLLMVHHTSRGASRLRGFDPPELADAAFSGMAEYVRQWVSLGRRSQYDPDSGRHELWLSIGGSAGQSGLYAVDVNEGRLGADFEGRVWEVDVMRPDDARKGQETATEKAKATKAAETLDKDKATVLRAFARFKHGETKNVVAEGSGISKGRFSAAVAVLVNECELEQIKIRKGKRFEEAFILAGSELPGLGRTACPDKDESGRAAKYPDKHP